MAARSLTKTFGYIYLCCIPVLTFILAFALGHITYKLYIPIWLLNFCIMTWAVWTLGRKAFRAVEKEKRYLAYGSSLLILTVCLLSILFGMGVPPVLYRNG